MIMDKKEITYNQAMAEIESILKRFESEDFDVDSLAEQVGRATELIKLCRRKLKKADDDVRRILDEGKE